MRRGKSVARTGWMPKRQLQTTPRFISSIIKAQMMLAFPELLSHFAKGISFVNMLTQAVDRVVE